MCRFYIFTREITIKASSELHFSYIVINKCYFISWAFYFVVLPLRLCAVKSMYRRVSGWWTLMLSTRAPGGDSCRAMVSDVSMVKYSSMAHSFFAAVIQTHADIFISHMSTKRHVCYWCCVTVQLWHSQLQSAFWARVRAPKRRQSRTDSNPNIIFFFFPCLTHIRRRSSFIPLNSYLWEGEMKKTKHKHANILKFKYRKKEWALKHHKIIQKILQ